MVGTPTPVALLSLPLWLCPPLLLIAVVARRRTVRVAFGAGLTAALTFLFAIFCQVLQGPGMPTWIDALILWGPTTLAMAGLAFLADRWLLPHQEPTTRLAPPNPPRARMGRMLTAAFVAWSALCTSCVVSPVGELIDIRFNSPTSGLVLPMPSDLRLISANRDCGSEVCSNSYLIGSPDQASPQELTERLWTHLVATKGWERLREDAGCQRPGWLLRQEFCPFTRIERRGSVDALKVFVTAALTVA